MVMRGFPQPIPMEEESPNGNGIFDIVKGWFGAGGTEAPPPPPQERSMSQDEKAAIERRIKDTDIDFEKEMQKERVKLTNVGINAWDEIKSAVRDGTIHIEKYTNSFLRKQLEKEGYFTQEDPVRFGDQIVTGSKSPQEDFGGKEKPPAQPPTGGPIQFDKEGHPIDMPTQPTGGLGGFIDMLFPPILPQEEEAALSPEDPEEAARKARAKDVEKTDSGLEMAHGEIDNEGERIWEEVRMKYLNTGGFDYANELQKVIERHRIPEPVDCVVDVAPWSDEGWVDNCDTHGVWVRSRQRPAKMTPPQYGGKPCPELPPSVEERPCDPVDAKWKWSDWSEPCAESSQYRDTILISHAKHGGQGYGAKHETRPCEMPPEPVDCVMGAWEAWQHNNGNLDGPDWPEWTAHPSGDGGQYRERMRYRYAIVDSQYGGEECKSSERTLVEKSPDGRLRETQFENDVRDTPVADETPSAGATTVVDEPEYIPCCPECPDGANCSPCHPLSVPCESTIVEDIVDALTNIFGGGEDTPSQPVEVDSGTSQDSLLPAQTTPVAPVETTPVVVDSATTQTSAPATASETPPLEVTVNLVQPASSGGGGGTPATTPTTTTTEEEEKEEEPEAEEGSNAVLYVGGLAVLSGIGYWAYKKYA